MLSLSTYLGHTKISNTYWYLSAVPELMSLAGKRLRALRCHRREPAMSKLTPTAPVPSFPALVQAFFTQHLPNNGP